MQVFLPERPWVACGNPVCVCVWGGGKPVVALCEEGGGPGAWGLETVLT